MLWAIEIGHAQITLCARPFLSESPATQPADQDNNSIAGSAWTGRFRSRFNRQDAPGQSFERPVYGGACGCGIFESRHRVHAPPGPGRHALSRIRLPGPEDQLKRHQAGPGYANADKDSHQLRDRWRAILLQPELGHSSGTSLRQSLFQDHRRRDRGIRSHSSSGALWAIFDSKGSMRGFLRINHWASASARSCRPATTSIMMPLGMSIATANWEPAPSICWQADSSPVYRPDYRFRPGDRRCTD